MNRKNDPRLILPNLQGCDLLKAWKAHRAGLDDPAGLFYGFSPAGYATQPRRLLYVGKATAGPFERVSDHEASRALNSAFWRFARRLGCALRCEETAVDEDPLGCVAWTNVSKTAAKTVKAQERFLAGAEKLAICTLRAETSYLKPNVIVFVCGTFGESVVREIAGGGGDHMWHKEGSHGLTLQDNIWWKRDPTGIPCVWMGHPQGKKRDLLEKAVGLIVECVESPDTVLHER